MLTYAVLKRYKKRARYESLTPRSFQRMLVFIRVITLKIVEITTDANTHVVCKSNNIIFTLNLLTTNLMNNVCNRHDYDAKVIFLDKSSSDIFTLFVKTVCFLDLSQLFCVARLVKRYALLFFFIDNLVGSARDF